MNFDELAVEVAKPAYKGLSDDATANAINAATVTRRRPYYPSARTLLAVIGPTKTEGLMGYLRANLPTVHAILLQPGAVDGSAGGLDVSLDTTRAFLDQFVAGQLLTQEEADAIKALADETVPLRETLGWGRNVWAGEVADARRINAHG